MKKLIAVLLGLFCLPFATAANNGTETDRVKDAGVVLKEILDIPDDIPKNLIDDAECVIVLPSVKKLAIGIGGSFGRGVMVCRTGQHFTGPWGAPAMYALEGGNIGFQLGGQATDFVLLRTIWMRSLKKFRVKPVKIQNRCNKIQNRWARKKAALGNRASIFPGGFSRRILYVTGPAQAGLPQKYVSFSFVYAAGRRI